MEGRNSTNSNYAKRFYNYLSSNNKQFTHNKRGDGDDFMLPVATREIPSVIVTVNISDSGKVEFCTGICSVSDLQGEYLAELKETINKLNDVYAFLSFCIDDDGDIRGNYSFFMSELEPFNIIERYIYTFVSIVESASKDILKAIWSARERSELKTKESMDEELFDEEIDDDSDDDSDDELNGESDDDADYPLSELFEDDEAS